MLPFIFYHKTYRLLGLGASPPRIRVTAWDALALLPVLYAGVMHLYMGIIHEISFLKSMRLPQLAM